MTVCPMVFIVDILHGISDFPLLSKKSMLFTDIGIAVILVLTMVSTDKLVS